MTFTAKVPAGAIEQTGLTEEVILAEAERQLADTPVYNEGVRKVDFLAVNVAEHISADMPADYRFAGLSGDVMYFFRAAETDVERESRAIDSAINKLYSEKTALMYAGGPESPGSYDESDDDDIIRGLSEPDAE